MNIVNVGYRSTNYYVLADHAPRLLVDAGWPGTLPTLLHQCQRHGVQLDAIPYLLVTHYHPDHAGLAQEIKRRGPKLIVLETQIAAVPLLRSHIKPHDAYVAIDLADAVTLSFADSRAFLARIGMAGEIISTPGHSDDSVSLVLDDGAAFTGDLTPYGATEEAAALAQASWNRLRAAHVTTIYPGHGPVRPLL